MPVLSEQMKKEYINLYESMVIRQDKIPIIDKVIQRIMKDAPRYKSVVENTKIPWFFIALAHNMERSGSFEHHLHNGDPLTDRTIQIPKGRPLFPKTGNSYTWEESAKDAIELKGYNKFVDWTIEWILYRLEGFNGFGYRRYKINTPYLWSFSNHYTKGKYVSDRKYDPNAVSQQIGCAILIKRMQEKGFITL